MNLQMKVKGRNDSSFIFVLGIDAEALFLCSPKHAVMTLTYCLPEIANGPLHPQHLSDP